MIDLSLYDNIVNITAFDEALQELDILFETKPTELIGQPTFGTDFERFLWEIHPSTEELEKYINEKISIYCYYLNMFKREMTIEAYPDDNSSTVYVVKILLYKNSYSNASERNYILKK